MGIGRFLAGSGLALTIGALASACGGDDTTGGTTGGTTTGSSTTGGGGNGGGGIDVACDGAPADLALAGTWAAYGRLAVTLEGAPGGAITICPADQIGESTLLLMITIDQTDPTSLSNVTATLCSLELPVVTALVGACDPASDSLVSTQIIAPQKLLDALPTILTTAVGGSLGGTKAGASVSLDRFTVTVGSTKAGAAMPSWDTASAACNNATIGKTTMCEATCVADCASLRDDDADGYPGVTAEVCGKTPSDASNGVACNAANPSDPGATVQGRASLDIQVNPQFTGSAKSSCELEGSIDTEVLYNVVGADVYLAGAPIGVTSAIKSLPSFTVVSADSKFRMIRIDGQYGAPDWSVDPTSPLAACATIKGHVNDF